MALTLHVTDAYPWVAMMSEWERAPSSRPSGRWSLMNSALLLVVLAMPFVMIGSFVTGLIILIGKPRNRHQTATTPRSRDL